MVFVVREMWPSLIVAFCLGAALGLILKRALSGVARKSDLPDMSYYMLKADVINAPDLGAYVRWTDLPDVSQFVSEDALAHFVKESEPDLSPYARREELGRLPQQQDLSDFVRKADDVLAMLEEKDREIEQLRESLEAERAVRAEAVARLEARLQEVVPHGTSSAPAAKPALELRFDVAPTLRKRLHRLGADTFRRISMWSDEDFDRVESRLKRVHERIRQEGMAADAGPSHRETHGESLG